MGCGSAEFVRNKLSRPCLAKRNGFADSFDAFNDLTFLTRRLRYSQFREPVEAIYAIFIDPPSDKAGQAILERRAARDHYPWTHPFAVKPFRRRWVPFVSPPPDRIISSIGTDWLSIACSSSAAESGKSIY